MVLSNVRRLQTAARQDRVKARSSNITLGDARLHSHGTSYRSDFGAPLESSSVLRSPLQVGLLYSSYASFMQCTDGKR